MPRNVLWFIPVFVAAAFLMLLQELFYDRAGRPWWGAVLLSLLTLAVVLFLVILRRRRGPRAGR